MRRPIAWLLVPLLVLPALWAKEDKPKDKPSTPAEQYQALLKEYQEEQQAYAQAFLKAKTTEERQKVAQEKAPKIEKYVRRFLELAKMNPKDTTAFDALAWVVVNARVRAAREANEAVASRSSDCLIGFRR